MNILDKYSTLSVATCGDPTTDVGASGSVDESSTLSVATCGDPTTGVGASGLVDESSALSVATCGDPTGVGASGSVDEYSALSVATCGDPTDIGACGDHTTDNTATPCRKYPRADFHDYNGGMYFVTVCTHDKCHYFGKINDGKMFLSKTGKALDEALRGCHEHFPDVEIPLFVVMPNHFHAIICVSSSTTDTYRPHNHGRLNQLARLAVATCGDPTLVTHHGSRLAMVVVAIKSAVTRFARRNNIEFNWQSRYHDHIIRGNHDGNKITEYIKNNVARWANDCYNK